MTDPVREALEPCPFCKKTPGTKVGPPALARCITVGCKGASLAAETIPEWNARLSARQQASVEWERLTSVIRPLIESVCSDGGSDAARLAKAISDALLAKYDISQKVEG